MCCVKLDAPRDPRDMLELGKDLAFLGLESAEEDPKA